MIGNGVKLYQIADKGLALTKCTKVLIDLF